MLIYDNMCSVSTLHVNEVQSIKVLSLLKVQKLNVFEYRRCFENVRRFEHLGCFENFEQYIKEIVSLVSYVGV